MVGIDQIDLYSNVFKWNMRTNNLICLDEKKQSLID